MSLSINDKKSINKRYVQGLKIAAITLFGLYLMGVSTAIILPGLEAPFTIQILTFLFLGGLFEKLINDLQSSKVGIDASLLILEEAQNLAIECNKILSDAELKFLELKEKFSSNENVEN